MEGRFVLWKMGDAGVCECGCRSLVDSVEVVSDGGVWWVERRWVCYACGLVRVEYANRVMSELMRGRCISRVRQQ